MKLLKALAALACLSLMGCVAPDTSAHPMEGQVVTESTKSVPLNAPAMYDHAYAGETDIRKVAGDNAWAECSNNGETSLPKKTVACAKVVNKVCVVYIATGRAGMDQAAVLRHEVAHCNGWPSDHRMDGSTGPVRTVRFENTPSKSSNQFAKVIFGTICASGAPMSSAATTACKTGAMPPVAPNGRTFMPTPVGQELNQILLDIDKYY